MEKDAKDYADSIHAIFVETSAKNAININELFIEISKYLNSLISKYLNYFLLQKTWVEIWFLYYFFLLFGWKFTDFILNLLQSDMTTKCKWAAWVSGHLITSKYSS